MRIVSQKRVLLQLIKYLMSALEKQERDDCHAKNPEESHAWR